MAEPLTADDLVRMEHRARKFQGAWTGTSGTLATDVMRLLEERRRLLAELALVVAAAGKAENYECWPDR
jgi:hypothetical protein